jgi:flagellin
MIINTNVSALNTLRQLGNNEKATQSSLAKLSSGLRINTAADDAAGLSISEKMRGQISGLNQASSNAQNAISLTSTAEGALNETTSILQRMRELAVQAGDGSTTTSDRSAMQQETNQLVSAINDIGNQTQFNTKNLLDGSQAGAAGLAVGQNGTTGGAVGKTLAAISPGAALVTSGAAVTFTAEKVNIDGTNINVNWQNLSTADQNTLTTGIAAGATTTQLAAAATLIQNTVNSAIDAAGAPVSHITTFVNAAKQIEMQSGSTGINSQITTTSGTNVINAALGGAAGTDVTINGTDNYNGTTVAAATSFNFTINGVTMQATSTSVVSSTTTMASAAIMMTSSINNAISSANQVSGATVSTSPGYIAPVTVNATTDGRLQVLSQSGPIAFQDLAGGVAVANLGLSSAATSNSNGGALSFQVGANAGQTLSFSISDMRASALGVSGIDLSTASSAANAVTTIDAATALVSNQRSQLGAVQNRLQHTINNLGTSSQNVTTAEANIRDVDMASEMTNFQKNNILQQAAQSMLAQANQQGQGVLKLLQ